MNPFAVTGLAFRLYFVRDEFSGGVYSIASGPGEDRDMPGGPVAFSKFQYARDLADRLSCAESCWTVVEASWAEAVAFCIGHNYTLWVTQDDGTRVYVRETLSSLSLPRILKPLTDEEKRLAGER